MKTTRKYPALGILFKEAMVQAILAGRKTQTRRILKPQPLLTERRWVREAEVGTLHVTQDLFGEGLVFAFRESMTTTRNLGAVNFAEEFAPIKVGEILYVKETFLDGADYACSGYNEDPESEPRYSYRADCPTDQQRNYLWKPSLYMPYEAARIFLKVNGVRVERLDDISEADAIAEGVHCYAYDDRTQEDYKNYLHKGEDDWGFSNAVSSYFSLWDLINGVDSHKDNPYVWVYTFERTEKPATE